MQDKENKKIPKHLGMLIICIPFFFFFNPNIAPIDVLPDFIGYIIICMALNTLADLNDDIESAKRNFQYMILVDICKQLSIMWLFGLALSMERNTGLLLLGFLFGVVELLLLVPAYYKLFGGMISLAYVHESTSILGKKTPDVKYSFTEKARRFTLIYIILQRVMAALPEFSNLKSYDYDETGVAVHSLYEYIGLLRATSIFVTLVFGIIWLCSMVRYFTRVRKDTAFVSSLTVTYERTVLPRVGLFVCRTIKRAHILFLIGSIFLLDFRLDDLNMLPDAIGIAFILGGIMTLCRYTRLPKGKFAFVLSIMIGISVGAYVMDMLFHMKYSYSAILRDVQAYDFFVVVCALSVLSVVLFTVLLAVLRNCANSVIDQHTGFTGEHFSKGDEKRLMDYHKELKRRFLYVYIMGMLVVAIDICRVILEYEYGYLGFLSIAVSAIFAATLYKQWGDIADCVETKYMLE